MKKTVLLGYLLSSALAFAQNPTVDKKTVAFTYAYNSGTALKDTVTAKLTTTAAMTVDYSSTPAGWLTVTPLAGQSPLVLSVTANPTSLSPGKYTGTINIHNGASYATTVPVSLSISNPSSSLLLSAPPTTTLTSTSATAYSVGLNYTSGGVSPTADIDVGTTGDIIPFAVTTAITKAGSGTATTANWLRVSNNSVGSPAATSTSGVAAGSSVVRIAVTLDQTALDTLDAVNYTGTITIAPVKTGSSSSGSSASSTTFTVTITLSVSPGSPILCVLPGAAPSCATVPVPVFPSSVPVLPAAPTLAPLAPTLTLYGDNFFYNGSWAFAIRPNGTSVYLPTTWVSRKILTATVPVISLTPPQVANAGESWNIVVVNGAPGTDPSNANATSGQALFKVTDPTKPSIQSVVNAASYLETATQLGAAANVASAVSPREIVSIFGLNLGPAAVCSNTPVLIGAGPHTKYDSVIATCNNIAVSFQVLPDAPWPAPLIMATSNQINAIVPAEMAKYTDGAAVIVSVTVAGVAAVPYAATKVSFDPGIFTFGGNGQGQAAVLNVDPTTGVVTVNGSAAAPKGSPIEIFMTGLGDLKVGYSAATGLIDGQVATSAYTLNDDTYRVLIGNQSAPIFYAGTAGTGVAGLVQINAIVPPGTASGAQPITVEIGPVIAGAVTARRSQTGVTINVK
jgi:uncharacterized protein (TIGR03437 family)